MRGEGGGWHCNYNYGHLLSERGKKGGYTHLYPLRLGLNNKLTLSPENGVFEIFISFLFQSISNSVERSFYILFSFSATNERRMGRTTAWKACSFKATEASLSLCVCVALMGIFFGQRRIWRCYFGYPTFTTYDFTHLLVFYNLFFVDLPFLGMRWEEERVEWMDGCMRCRCAYGRWLGRGAKMRRRKGRDMYYPYGLRVCARI